MPLNRSGNRRAASLTQAVRSTSAASCRGLPKSQTAPRDFYISGKPAGKGAAGHSSSKKRRPAGLADVISDQALLLPPVSCEPVPRRQIREGTKARLSTSI
jgi:hypothetical protein